MHIIKVKQNGKLKMYDTIRMNMPTARVPKSQRRTVGEIIEQRKRAERNARLVQIITR